MVPEVVDKKGAILNKELIPHKDDWLIDLKVNIGNTQKSNKGGAGLGLYYLKEIDGSQIGTGVFGYTRQFNGMAVFLNSLFNVNENDKTYNYVQAFTNDGTQLTNPMKIKGEKNCKVIFRNTKEGEPFHIRLEYKKPSVSLFYYDHASDNYETCMTFDYEMDYEGIFMITGASGLNNPDHIYIDSFAMYDPSERVSEGHNQHFHDAHKKKATHDMA